MMFALLAKGNRLRVGVTLGVMAPCCLLRELDLDKKAVHRKVC